MNKLNNINDKILLFNKEKYNYISQLINLKKKYKIKFIKYKNYKLMGLYDNNINLLIGKYYFYGIYQKSNNLWIWASSIPGVDKYHIMNINKIRSLDYLFEASDDAKINFYYQLLTQDILYINDIKYLKWINELLIYLSNDIHCFTRINKEGNIEFISLYKIKEQFV